MAKKASTRLFDINKIPQRIGTSMGADTGESPARQVSRGPQPEALKMFMTPREIEENYQPLDADREEGGGSGPVWVSSDRPRRDTSTYYEDTGVQKQRAFGMIPRSSQWPTRPPATPAAQQRLFNPHQFHVTGISSHYKPGDRPLGTPYPNEGHGSSTLARHGWMKTMRSTTDTENVISGHWTGGSSSGSGVAESDEELWNRKYEEGEYRGLHQRIEKEGGVKYPISLGREKGSMGKKEIVGGHHRLAYMREQRPEDYVPVLHFQNIHQARRLGHVWPYT